MQLPYRSPAAFRRALTDKLRDIASPNGPWSLADLQRQFAYDRLLARLYLVDDRWVVKGATALLARDIAVRHTMDIDVYRATSRDAAEKDLRQAAAQDPGDWFVFELGTATPVADGVNGIRVPITAVLGAAVWTRFHVDVVADAVRMTGIPDEMPPLTPIDIPGLARPNYRVYPLVDHIADKVAAIVERRRDGGRPSTRFKDLADLVAILGCTAVTADAQSRALRSESDRRDLDLQAPFDVPDRRLWETGYAAEARRAPRLRARSLEDALAMVTPFVNPLLLGTAAGVWNPRTGDWEP